MKRTNAQNKRMYQLFSKLGIDADLKAELVLQFSNSRTEKSSELLLHEAGSLIRALEAKWEKRQRMANDIKQRRRREVFKLSYDIGFINNRMTTAEKLNKINGFIAHRAKSVKHLNELSEAELDKLIKQLRAVRRNYTDEYERMAHLN